MLDKTEKTEYETVFTAYKSGALILVEGCPGSGKTTLVHKIIKDWAEGNVLVQAKLAFLVSLRMLSNNISQEDSLYTILKQFYNNDVLLNTVVSDLERNSGEGACFVFDGLDEYHPHLKDKSIVFRLLHKSFLPQAMIIVSSRPGAMVRLRQKSVTQHIEVFGFTKDHISDYIDKFPFDANLGSSFGPDMLKEYLSSHPNVLHMCYLPIHAAIICFVYNTERGQLPHTQTKIYYEFTRAMILRYLKRNNKEMELVSLKDLPIDTCKYFDNLCRLAFNMTVESKQVINACRTSFPLSEDTSPHGDWSLGLVTCNHTGQLGGVNTSYMFLHLTLQEYLAAYYIAHTEEEKKLQIIEKLKPELHSAFHSMWSFYFGLETFTSQNQLTEYEFRIGLLKDKNNCYAYAFESQHQIVCDEIVRINDGKIRLFRGSPSDCQALVFTISNTSHPIKELVLGHIEDCDIFQQIQHLKFLVLERLNVDIANARELQSLSTILESCKVLKRLELTLSTLTVEEGEYLADKLKFLTNLEYFSLIHLLVLVPNTGLISVIKQLHCLTQMKTLRLFAWKMDVNSCQVLASNICHLIHMQVLRLNGNNIGQEGMMCLASTFQHLTKLERLSLNDNNIGSDGAIRLASEVYHLTSLKSLSLSGNDINAHSAIQVIATLKDCRKLTYATINKSSLNNRRKVNITFQLQGLIATDDSATIDSVIAATREHNKDVSLDLGFKTIDIFSNQSSNARHNQLSNVRHLQSSNVRPHQSSNARPHQSSNARPHQSSNARPHQSSNARPHQSSNARPHQSSNARSHQSCNARPHQSSNARPHQSSNARPHQSSNARSHQSCNARPHQSSNARLHQSSNARPHQSSNARPHQSSNARPHQSSNARPHQSSNARSHQSSNARPHQSSNARPHQSSNARPHQSSNARPHQSSNARPHQSSNARPHQSSNARPHQSSNARHNQSSKASNSDCVII